MSYLRHLRRLVGNQLLLVPSVAAVIQDTEGRLLLQQKSGSEGWSLPAGAIEPGETPETAIMREVVEETGLDVEIEALLGLFGGEAFRYKYPNGDEVEYTVALFRCHIVGKTGKPLDGETVSLRYFTRSDFPGLALPYPADLLFS